MKKIFIVPALFVLVATACKNKSEAEEQAATPPTTTPVNVAATTTNPATTTPAQISTVPVNPTAPVVNQPAVTTTPVNIPMPAATTTTTKTAAGLNPAHGQPNHRCDIPVGAPLNSPPGNNATPTVTTTTTPPTNQTMSTISTPPVINTAPAPVTKTAPGMNPAHGEPGHRCDIAVGAPLNSPKGNQQTVTIPATSLPAATPVKQN